MFVFGVDIPLVELILILTVIILIILVLFIYLAVKIIEMNRRMDKFATEEKREFKLVKTLSKELMGTSKSEVKELNLLKELRTDIHELVKGGKHIVRKAVGHEKRARRKKKAHHVKKAVKRKIHLMNKHKELVTLLGRVDGFLAGKSNRKSIKKKGLIGKLKNKIKRTKKVKSKKHKKSKAKKKKSVKRSSKKKNQNLVKLQNPNLSAGNQKSAGGDKLK